MVPYCLTAFIYLMAYLQNVFSNAYDLVTAMWSKSSLACRCFLLTIEWAGFQVTVNFDKMNLSKLKWERDRSTKAFVGDTAYCSLSAKMRSCGRDDYRWKVRGKRVVKTLNPPYRYCRADTVPGGDTACETLICSWGRKQKTLHWSRLLHLMQMSDSFSYGKTCSCVESTWILWALLQRFSCSSDATYNFLIIWT